MLMLAVELGEHLVQLNAVFNNEGLLLRQRRVLPANVKRHLLQDLLRHRSRLGLKDDAADRTSISGGYVCPSFPAGVLPRMSSTSSLHHFPYYCNTTLGYFKVPSIHIEPLIKVYKRVL